MSYYGNIREHELNLKVGEDFFSAYDKTIVVGDIDFSVFAKTTEDKQLVSVSDRECFLWAESKRGTIDLVDAFTQLVLTIGKARTFDDYLPPAFLGAFDADKIGFIPYNIVLDVFYQNDFNWNVTPSDHSTKEFQQVKDLIEKTIKQGSYVYRYTTDADELAKFIKDNFKSNKKNVSRTRVTKNNFVSIYLKWRKIVMPTIDIKWDIAKKQGILDADFYLADLLSENDLTIKDKLNVVLRQVHYELNRKINELGLFSTTTAEFKDERAKHIEFWNKYVRPPKRDYWDFIIERRDLLIPQDMRERKGSFFTPAVWVAKAQEYLAAVLGENWQEEYYIWDCCAGTGNLEAGLLHRHKIWASTLDKSDVDVMIERIANGANLLPSHVFQFDFLNGDFNKLPGKLREIISDPEKRKKLVIFINPPYAEAGDARQTSGTGKNKKSVATENTLYMNAKNAIGKAVVELFAQFFYRIYKEIDGCILAEFSKLKHIQTQNFKKFNSFFLAKLLKMFVVPANTFDNVKGKFPIGFFIWDTGVKERFTEITADVFSADDSPLGTKRFKFAERFCINWIQQYYDKNQMFLCYLRTGGSDMANQARTFLTLRPSANDLKQKRITTITAKNLIQFSIYFSARMCIKHNWLNDRDQYLWPNDNWQKDKEFQADCLTYMVFSRSNNIKSADGTNHFIPFTEEEVNANDEYTSHFLLDYISGRWKPEVLPLQDGNEKQLVLFANSNQTTEMSAPIVFSAKAQAVFNTARKLWCYYHSKPNADANAAFYDIRDFFQGRDNTGKMNKSSTDQTYNTLLDNFNKAYETRSKKIEPKIYQYGFLLK